MYCPVCGAESTQGLNYCKRCGAGLGLPVNSAEPKGGVSKLVALAMLPTLVSAVGLIGLFTTASEMRGLDPRFLVAIVAFSGATVVGVVMVLAWLLLRLSGLPQSAMSPREPAPPPAMRHQPAELPPPRILMPSVTEHTTRNFEASGNRDELARE